MRPLVLYHANCRDGHCAAWVAQRAMPDAEFAAVTYQSPTPPMAGRAVTVLDFSFPREQLLAMDDETASLLVLDHHEAAVAPNADLPFVQYTPDACGALMAWQHFFPNEAPPAILAYVDHYDRGDYFSAATRWTDAEAVLAAVDLLERPANDFSAWDDITARPIADLAAEGAAVVSYRDFLVRSMAANARVETFQIPGLVDPYASLRAPVANAPVLHSEVGALLARSPGPDGIVAPCAGVWSQHRDGRTRLSFRANDAGFDVRPLAQALGGNGHRSAAGCFVEGAVHTGGADQRMPAPVVETEHLVALDALPAVARFRGHLVTQLLAHARTVDLHGVRAVLVNAPILQTPVSAALLEEHEIADVAVAWHVDADGMIVSQITGRDPGQFARVAGRFGLPAAPDVSTATAVTRGIPWRDDALSSPRIVSTEAPTSPVSPGGVLAAAPSQTTHARRRPPTQGGRR